MGSAVNAELVGDALLMAFQRRRPDRRVVHHSDRGVYTSLAFSSRLAELELDQSFSAVGSCYDNAAVKSFFATLKRELAWIHQRTTWVDSSGAPDRAVRLHRRFLQPRTNSTTPRSPQPHRLRTPRRRVTATCPRSRVKTSAGCLTWSRRCARTRWPSLSTGGIASPRGSTTRVSLALASAADLRRLGCGSRTARGGKPLGSGGAAGFAVAGRRMTCARSAVTRALGA